MHPERIAKLVMNNKENEFKRIVDIVVDCCVIGNQDREELRRKVIGECREEPIVMTRCMLARLLAFAGFTNSTIAFVMGRENTKCVRSWLEMAKDYRNNKHIYRIAEDEAMLKYIKGDEKST